MKILKLPDNTVVIGEEAFMNSGCEAVIVNDACERIEAGAFGECDKLKYISVSPNTVINKDAFAGSADVVVLYRE